MALVVKNSFANAGKAREAASILGSGRSSGEGNATLVFLPGTSHGQIYLMGHHPQGSKESGTTWQLNNNNLPTYHMIQMKYFEVNYQINNIIVLSCNLTLIVMKMTTMFSICSVF